MSKVKLPIIWSYLIAGYASLLCLGFLDNTRASVFENMTRDLGLTDERASLFFVVPSFVAFLSSMLSERLVLKMSSVNLLRLGLTLKGLAFVMFGLTEHFHLILAETVVFGIGFGFVSVAQNVAVGQASNSADIQRQLFSGLHSMYALASLFSPVVAGFLFAQSYSWGQVFLGTSVFPFMILVLTFLISYPEESEGKHSLDKVKSDFNYRHGLFFAISMSTYLVAEISASSRMVPYVRRELAISDAQGALYLGAFFLALLSGRILFTFVKFKRFETHHLMYISLLGAFFLYALGLTFSPLFMAASGFFMAPFFPLVMDYAVRVFHQHSGRVIAYCMAFASLSVVFMHYGLGMLSDIYGLKIALWLGPAGLMSCFLMFQLERRLFQNS